jgi:hypothetical protein
MKRNMSLLLSIVLILLSITAASALTVIDPTADRGIAPKGDPSVNNPRIPGESMTTGLPFEGDYVPILVNIDNVAGAWPHWGVADADIIYELPIHGLIMTRLMALFADRHPAEAGPVRSGRVLHAELREEWDAGWTFVGIQKLDGTNVHDALREFGARHKTNDLIYDLAANKWSKHSYRVKGYNGPHNLSVKVLELVEVAKGYAFPERPFLFTDALPTTGEPASQIQLVYGGNDKNYTNSSFTYDAAANVYARYRAGTPYADNHNPDMPLTFSNVIVQWTDLSFNGKASAPVLKEVGQGNADIFTGGRHIAGYWVRSDVTNRTVFYDQDGNEIVLQRGKTWINVTTARATEVTYQ